MTDDATSQKRCCTCGETKSIELFSKNKSEKDGRQRRCKSCVSNHYAVNAKAVCAHVREFTKKNAEVIRERRRGYYANNIEKRRAYLERNAEKIREYRHGYRQNNGEKIRKYSQDYRAANPDVIPEKKREYYFANADRILAKKRADYAADPDKYIAIGHNRRARVKGNGGSYTSAEIKAMRIAQAGICAYCGQQHDPDALTIDHRRSAVKPLALAMGR